MPAEHPPPVCAVIGSPVGHTLSPVIHRAAFAAAVEFKFAHSGSLEHQYQIGAEQFKKLVEEKSYQDYRAGA